MLNEKQTLEHILKSNNRESNTPSIQGKMYRVYNNLKVDNKATNVIEFDNGNFVVQDKRKTHYLELGEYLLTLSTHHDEPDMIDMKYTHLYRVKDGQEFPVNFSGKCYSGCVVVIDRKLLAICSSDSYPQFIAIINDTLVLLPCLVAEQIIRNFALNEKQLKSLIRMYPDERWKLHNGIAINSETMDVPTSLQISDWKRRTRTKALNIDTKISAYYSVLLRKEKNESSAIKYIRSSDF